jgi:hypothetical protein
MCKYRVVEGVDLIGSDNLSLLGPLSGSLSGVSLKTYTYLLRNILGQNISGHPTNLMSSGKRCCVL